MLFYSVYKIIFYFPARSGRFENVIIVSNCGVENVKEHFLSWYPEMTIYFESRQGEKRNPNYAKVSIFQPACGRQARSGFKRCIQNGKIILEMFLIQVFLL